MARSNLDKRKYGFLTERQTITLAATILTIATCMHILRLFYKWNVSIGTFQLPTWVSMVGIVLAGYVSYELWMMISKED